MRRLLFPRPVSRVQLNSPQMIAQNTCRSEHSLILQDTICTNRQRTLSVQLCSTRLSIPIISDSCSSLSSWPSDRCLVAIMKVYGVHRQGLLGDTYDALHMQLHLYYVKFPNLQGSNGTGVVRRGPPCNASCTPQFRRLRQRHAITSTLEAVIPVSPMRMWWTLDHSKLRFATVQMVGQDEVRDVT